LFPHGDFNLDPHGESPWVCVHSSWSPYWERKTCTNTHTHALQFTYTACFFFSGESGAPRGNPLSSVIVNEAFYTAQW